MSVTLKDIARETNFSITTVSLVLNKQNCRVSEKTRSIIVDAAKRMNYYPNQLAVGLVKQETKTVGLIIPDIKNYFFSTLASGIDDEMLKHNRNIILCNTNDKVERDLQSIRVLKSRGVDAIILVMSSEIEADHMEEYKELINNSTVPIIMVDRYKLAFNCSVLALNNRKGAFCAVNHLLELGHKKIVCITGPISSNSSQERLAGYELAYKEAGVPLPDKYIFEGDYLYRSGEEAIESIIKETDATAVFAFNDLMAIAAMNRLQKKGFMVAGDISIVGFDNIDFLEMLEVPLTTVNQPTYEIGQAAAKQAILELENPGCDKQSISFEPQLVIRKSTGALK